MKKIIFIILFLLNQFSTIFSNASNSIIKFENIQKSSLIGKDVYILKDPTNKLDIKSIKTNTGFFKSTSDVPNLGVSACTYWVKFSIQNLSNEENLLLEFSQPFINDVVLYSPNGENFDVQFSGDNYNFSSRKYKCPNYLFDINIKYNETKTFFLKVTGDEQILLPLKIGTPKVIVNALRNYDIIFGIYIGVILVMLFYNLFIYFSIRDKIYLKYVIYVFFIGFTQASILGYPFEYLWPNCPFFANLSIYVFSCCVGISALEFFKSFLQTKKLTPKLHYLSFVITGLYTLTGILSILGFMHIAYLMVQGCAVLISIYMLTGAIVISKKGSRPAVYFLVAWSVMLMGIIIFILKDFGILPYNNFTNYTMPIGSAIETILLSFALADRINILRKEKEDSQFKNLELLKENEQIIKEQNINLETKVKERTAELEAANKNLKEAETILVNAEKMASLGQLTAGISHEINNPINFVVSNIKPLRRDIEEILLILKKYNEIKDVKNLKEKLEEINILKEKRDLDYSINEINLLLNGIDEGAKRTSEIVKGLRNFSRTDESDLKKINIHEGLESTLTLLNNKIVNTKIKVIKNFGALPAIECYPGKLNQVFMNLLSNAIHAIDSVNSIEKGGIITISTEQNEKNVTIKISDNGIGIPSKNLSKIFEPFFTTKEVGQGTGLGLSIVYGIVKSHNGNIDVMSEENKKTSFIITLPIFNQK